MRLIHYINENVEKIKEIDDPDDAIKILKKKCSKYIKETKGNWFVRGLKKTYIDEYSLNYKTIRKKRRPLGMNLKIFKKFNSWLEKNGHVRRDQSISATSDIKHAKFFIPFITGSLIVPFIEGNYDYTWVKTKDINQHDFENKWYGSIVRDYVNIDKKDLSSMDITYILQFLGYEKHELSYKDNMIAKKWLKENFPKYFTTNKGMQTAYKNKYEIWFNAKGYYFVNYDGELHKYLKEFI